MPSHPVESTHLPLFIGKVNFTMYAGYPTYPTKPQYCYKKHQVTSCDCLHKGKAGIITRLFQIGQTG